MSDDPRAKAHAEREFFEFDKAELNGLLVVAAATYRNAVRDLERAIEFSDPLPRVIMLDRECDARSADITRIISMIETGGRWA